MSTRRIFAALDGRAFRVTTPMTPAPADICTGSYFYKRKCDGAWMVGWPNDWANTTYQGGGAHTWIAHDQATGKDYSIGDQGVNNPNAYQKPPDAAPYAQAEWNRFYVDHNPPPGYETVAAKTPPGGFQSLPAVPLSMVTDPAKKASWTAQFHCEEEPPMLPTFCPHDSQLRQQTAAMIYNAMKWLAQNNPGLIIPLVPRDNVTNLPIQIFEDVPTGYPFEESINALGGAGIVAGGPCKTVTP